MNKKNLQQIAPHVVAILAFLVFSFAFFSPVLENKTLDQYDTRHWMGMSKEIRDYHDQTGHQPLWTNSMFSGMPSYLISTPPTPNLFIRLHNILSLNHLRPVSFMFLLLIGFYVTLLIFRVNPYLAIFGCIAFGLSTRFLDLMVTGHSSKIMALGYMSPIVGGVYLAYRRNRLLGAVITAIALSIQLVVNHLQITYYTFLIVLVFGIFELINAIRNRAIPSFLKTTGILLFAALLAVGSNIQNFWLVYQYSKVSMRGPSELSGDQQNTTKGLDRDYVTAWSYGIDETLTLLIPNFKGGASGAPLGENSDTYKLFEQSQGRQYAERVTRNLPVYWGNQPFTGGPVYVGAGIFFLFVLGMFLLRGRDRWWILAVSILAIMLAWGKNFMALTNLFLDYFPGYNKFRDVTTLLVIVQFTFPLLAMITFQKVLDANIRKPEFIKAFKNAIYVVGGLTLLFALIPGAFFDFSAPSDAQYSGRGMQAFVDALVSDRKMLLRNDSFRSLVFVGLTALVVYYTFIKKIKPSYAIAGIGLILMVDLWGVGKRYVNDDDFVRKQKVKEAYQPTQADLAIMRDTTMYYRVLDLTTSPFQSSRASYFHKSIGGYHGAKLRRYQDLYDRDISRNNMNVLNMLNTKYFIVPTDGGPPEARINNAALGNAWFVRDYRILESADQEIDALENFDPARTAIVDRRFARFVEGKEFSGDSSASISLTSYDPEKLTYSYQAGKEGLAVFSDIYYNKGWHAYIDGNPAPYFRVDYVLRAMVLPAGSHKVSFEFKPKAYTIGRKIVRADSIILLLLALGTLYWEFRKSRMKQESVADDK